MDDRAVARVIGKLAEDLRDISEQTAQLADDIEEGRTPEVSDPPGFLLARERNKAGLSQVQLSQMTGVNVNTIANFENGRTRPRMRTLMILAEPLGLSWEDLQEGTKDG